jgi:hypothetical protein
MDTRLGLSVREKEQIEMSLAILGTSLHVRHLLQAEVSARTRSTRTSHCTEHVAVHPSWVAPASYCAAKCW